jgi:hypothetical protein
MLPRVSPYYAGYSGPEGFFTNRACTADYTYGSLTATNIS